ncbi:hypothetical protein CHUAL_001543 [Chamberlinius hualienensis]
MNTSGIRRNFKNIVHNYSDCQVKVREATSNDPWGPSSTLMSEIADLTYNVVAFSEIMQMIWKRLNDHGKNWRHVYKALVLLEYLIKTGTEKVAQQCKENYYAIETLKDFQYFEENKDHGMNVREKAKQLMALLKDDERLKNERIKALKARERFAQATSGIGNDVQGGNEGRYRTPEAYQTSLSPSGSELDRPIGSDLECARPQTAGEEELQLQLALAMSKEEAEQEDQKRKSDDVRLQMAITQSEEDFTRVGDPKPKQSNLVDLLDVDLPESVFSSPLQQPPLQDPWGLPITQPPANRKPIIDPWAPVTVPQTVVTPPPLPKDPWTARPSSSLGVPTSTFNKPTTDLWATSSTLSTNPWETNSGMAFGSTPSLTTNGDLDPFDPLTSVNATSKSANDLDMLSQTDPFNVKNNTNDVTNSIPRKPESFLGPNSNLVNLDALIISTQPTQMPGSTNPFAVPPNAFQVQPPRMSLNQIKTQQQFGSAPMPAYPPMDPFYRPTMTAPYVPPNTVAPTGEFGRQQPLVNNPFL